MFFYVIVMFLLCSCRIARWHVSHFGTLSDVVVVSNDILCRASFMYLVKSIFPGGAFSSCCRNFCLNVKLIYRCFRATYSPEWLIYGVLFFLMVMMASATSGKYRALYLFCPLKEGEGVETTCVGGKRWTSLASFHSNGSADFLLKK